jgi:hypothetical protein
MRMSVRMAIIKKIITNAGEDVREGTLTHLVRM